jgi:hypothetical protein
MTLIELIGQVQNNLARTDSATKTMINTAINQVLEQISKMQLNIYKVNTTLATTADVEYVSLSALTEFYGCVEDGVTIEDGDDWSELLPMLQSLFDITSDTGKPTDYSLVWTANVPYLYFRPVPDDAYNIKLWYYSGEPELTSTEDDNTSPKLSTMYGDMPIIAGATFETAMKLDLKDIAQQWYQRYMLEINKLRDWDIGIEGSEKHDGNIYL